MKFITEHVQDTENPQTYWRHFKFGFTNSVKLIGAGFVGIIHAACPWWFPFVTSSVVIKSFKKLVDSRRHKEELLEIMPNGYIHEVHMVKKTPRSD